MNVNELPDSVNDAIAFGLQRLFALRLENAPAMENMREVVPMWLEALAHDHHWDDGDAERFRVAFLNLSQSCQRWPSPTQVLRAMPPRAPLPALEAPKMTDEDRTAFDEMLSAILAGMHINVPNYDKPAPRWNYRHDFAERIAQEAAEQITQEQEARNGF